MDYEVNLTALTYGGDALGRLPDGRAVFVPFALPGEIVRLKLTEEKRGYARGELLEVIQPAAERIRPRCSHYTVCGGCHYQHLPYAEQLAAKGIIVGDQLRRIAGVQDARVATGVSSPAEWFYRNTIQFHLSPEGKLGFLASDSHTVIPISECFLPETILNGLWPQLEFEPGTGLERIELRLGSEDETMLVLEGNDPDAPEFTTDLPVSAVYCGGGKASVLAGDSNLVMEAGGRSFQVSAQSFFQVNTRQAQAMVEFLLARLPLTQATTVLDVYCGVGFFSAFLASKVDKVVGVELSPSACEDFAANLDEFDNVDLYMGAAENVLPGLAIRADVALVDPPRAGMGPGALHALLALQPRVIAYVSCNLATLARDTRRLIQGGYRLEEITPFDLFPQTYPVETVSLFSRESV